LSVICIRSVVFYGYFRFPAPIQLTAILNWNIVESGVKHHNSNPFFFWILSFLSDLRLLIIPSVPSNLIYAFWLSPQYLQTWFTASDYPLGTFKLDLRLLIIPLVSSNLIYAFWLSPRYLQIWFTPSDYPLGIFKLDLRLI
jgi:hypothetical protein